LLQHLPAMLGSANLTGELSTFARKASEGVIGLIVVVVVGVYAGANPSLYERGVLKLFPDESRGRAREVFSGVIHTLRWWMLGQLVPMIAVGIATTIAFEIIDVQPAFTLGLFTGMMVFIPYIGSLIAFAVVLLLVLVQGVTKVLSVTILFVAIHVAEGYLLTPMMQRRAVYLPPALTIVTQVLMGLLLGFIGFALATPLTAAALLLVRMLYLHEAPESQTR
jgi:predicted PurR-regulated permease PerM